MDGLASTLGFIAGFFPPDLSPAYLLALAGPVLETLGMTFGAMLLASVLSLPVGLYLGLGGPGAGVVRAVLSGVRAIPDLTLAILCVIFFGIGPGAGLTAIAVFYTAAMSKNFGDLFATAPPGPVAALRATGARPVAVALYALVPLKSRDLLTYASYEVECALRASVIIGAVGGGGLGAELVGTLNAFDFQRSTTLILVLIVLVAAIDQITLRLRARPVWLLALVPPSALALWLYLPAAPGLGFALQTVGGMFPPQLDAGDWAALPALIWETVRIAVLGTALGAALALPMGLASTRGLSPAILAVPVRRLLEALRAVPEVVFGLILVATAGVGPTAGILALGLHSGGCLGRLFAESFENVRPGPVQAVAATGARPLTVAAYATAPLALGPLAVHTLFRLEWNLRQATVVGMIGAGGIGQALFQAQQLFFYQKMMAYLLITWVLVLLVDRASAWTRRRAGWMELAPEEMAAG
ncbi:PhnE/PtxC family ABC transporter permease [Acidimangrovimonas sediminis]|uniref:PhnE/PtxC family ABC transporter permease n=1 Tax=Acidimangrovimonas sediminis TaxID=2056283 RepID=UPI000C7FDC3F|nr:ABC transporter permease subunit [Acidimangrovimonas sediminis]